MTSEQDVRGALRQYRETNDVPGAVLCAFTSAGEILAVGDGTTSIESPEQRMTPETVFRMYSVAKMMTATMIVSLASEGVLDLDELSDRYVEGIRRRSSTCSDGTTLRHLLSHQSGLLPDAVIHEGLGRDPDGLAASVIRDYRRTPVIAPPGHVYGYSNLGVSLAGLAAERVTGVPFEQLMAETVFIRFGMLRSFHDPVIAMTYPLAQHHIRQNGRLRVVHDAKAGSKLTPSSLCFTTVSDLALFGSVHLRTALEGSQMSPLRQMHSPHSSPRLDVDIQYGLGTYLYPHQGGFRPFGHEGFYDGMWVKLFIDPSRDLGVVWMDNRGEELREERYSVIDKLFDGLGRSKAPEDDTAQRETQAQAPRMAGQYSRTGAAPLSVVPDEDCLLVASDGQQMALEAYGRNVWRSKFDCEPSGAPWGPHSGTKRICLGSGPGPDPDGQVSVVHLNGLPYKRTA
ncbi:serine hydrolase domain-containing protein [Arthrobacter sp. E44]|uniref:serine hydrolase domain-containing protein n=1 Tax=Arthrobacter sp. E44 TaxID=3341794 RepID=UPI0035A6643D